MRVKTLKYFFGPIIGTVGAILFGVFAIGLGLSGIVSLIVLPMEWFTGNVSKETPLLLWSCYIASGIWVVLLSLAALSKAVEWYQECSLRVRCEENGAPNGCDHPEQHKMYHVMYLKCPCGVQKDENGDTHYYHV